MVKMDVEGVEVTGIDTWLDEGAFKNVHQFALEYHFWDTHYGHPGLHCYKFRY